MPILVFQFAGYSENTFSGGKLRQVLSQSARDGFYEKREANLAPVPLPLPGRIDLRKRGMPLHSSSVRSSQPQRLRATDGTSRTDQSHPAPVSN
jgi:hypothetical protein